LFDGENISFDASLVIYINSTIIPPITIINRIYEHQNLLSLWLGSFLVGLRTYQHPCTYRCADKSLARSTSRFILFDGENISFDASLVIYINSTNIPPIMITNRIYEHRNRLSLWLVSFLAGLRTYQHPCICIENDNMFPVTTVPILTDMRTRNKITEIRSAMISTCYLFIGLYRALGKR